MLLFASFQGESVPEIARLHRSCDTGSRSHNRHTRPAKRGRIEAEVDHSTSAIAA